MEENKDIKMTQGTARTERLFGHQPEEDAIVL